ncbi:hypothetical protein G6F70_005774 [Rhizopus microsporus]|nr:hypothetical protein G6F71_005574 [Rhizopus microsporus]KAG1198451.1 hypothetical protein G6F70_005774 [Rhizopus microsporus]KAG1207945.1 hypothetical protein G6F69_007636 [Rhizopus microsporus]KAG1231979.1 hypothetical protein G6F67_005361 [Rhizopus microsporus]
MIPNLDCFGVIPLGFLANSMTSTIFCSLSNSNRTSLYYNWPRSDPGRYMITIAKRLPAVVTVPKTRAQTTTILGAISASGLIKCSLRLPQPPAKKRKREGYVGLTSTGTVTGHYFSFLKATMDEMDQYSHMKGHYLIMDNAPIHKSEDIAKYIISRGYRYAYLPSYSPELNPIEQFWSVVKSKLKSK